MNELLDLLDDLVAALERREGAEPDMGEWEADRDVGRLERQLVAEYRAVRNETDTTPQAQVPHRRPAILIASR
jgi:hypothetical protein